MNARLNLAALLADADSEPSLSKVLEAFAESLGATYFVCIEAIGARERRAFRIVHNCSPDLYAYLCTPDLKGEDPVNAAIMASSEAIYWDRVTFEVAGLLDSWQKLKSIGATHGIATRLGTALNKAFVLALDWTDARPLPIERRQDALDAVNVCAALVSPAASRIWSQMDLAEPPAVTLARRELECLTWASRGMKDVDIATILNIGPRSVKKYMESAMQKLGASTRTQAAVLATRMNLLQVGDERSVSLVLGGKNQPGSDPT